MCLVWLVPVLWMAGLDARSGRGLIVWSEDDEGEDRRIFDTAVCSAALRVTDLFRDRRRTRERARRPRTGATLLIALVWSVAAHLVLFGALFLALLAVRGVVRLAGGRPFTKRCSCSSSPPLLGALVFKQIVFAAISFTGPVATGVALAFAVSRRRAVGGRHRAAATAVAPADPQRPRGPDRAARVSGASRSAPWRRAFCLAAIAAAAWFLSRQTAMMDWNYLLQKVSAIAVWIARLRRAVRHARRHPQECRPGPRSCGCCWGRRCRP